VLVEQLSQGGGGGSYLIRCARDTLYRRYNCGDGT